MSDQANAGAVSDELTAAVDVFKYFEEVTNLRTRTTYTIDSYEDVVWIADIPVEPEITCAAIRAEESDSEDTWLSVAKPKLKPPPDPPSDIGAWILLADLQNSGLEMPELQEEITIEDTVDGEPTTTVVHLDDHPTLQASWERYVERDWWPWAAENRRARLVYGLYSQLFSMYQRQQRMGEEYEIVLGLGLLRWQPPEGHEIKRHLVVANGTVTFDPSRGLISFGPSGSGLGMELERDMLAPDQRPDSAESEAVAAMVADIGDAVWDEALTSAPLKIWVNSVSSKGTYSHQLAPQGSASPDPTVHVAPAIILRRRAERSLLKVIRDIAKSLSETGDIPQSLEQLISARVLDAAPVDQYEGDPEAGSQQEIKDVYFPLPANDDQFDIVRRLQGQRGVLVQGPPGTGKSHTIVNLVCHLLATGQRVLVTSHGARALQVLRRYLSEKCADVSPLAVLLLGNDREALRSMEESVQGITTRHNSWQSGKADTAIDELEQELARLRSQDAELRGKIRDLRMVELDKELDRGNGYRGSPQALAQRIAREREGCRWLPDAVEVQEPCLDQKEAAELSALLSDPEVQATHAEPGTLPDRAGLPTPEEISEQFSIERRSQRQLAEAESAQTHDLVSVIQDLPSEERQALATAISQIQEICVRTTNGADDWEGEALAGALTQHVGFWQELADGTRERLGGLAEEARWADDVQVTGLDDRDAVVVKAEATDLLRHIENGGGLGWGPFRAAEVKRGLYLTKDVRIQGRFCADAVRLESLLRWMEATQRVEGLGKLWAGKVSPSASTLSGRVAELTEAHERLERILSGLGDLEFVDATLNGQAGIETPEDISRLVKACETVEIALRHQKATARINEALSVVVPYPSESACAVADALQRRDAELYGKAIAELERLEKLHAAAVRLRQLRDKLSRGAPLLGRSMDETPSDGMWQERLPRLSAAWAWRRTAVWLEEVSDPGHSERLRLALENCTQRIAATMEQLVANRAWRECFGRMGEFERQHLIAWARAVRQIGKGTGKYASRHRRTANEHMQRCQGAIPAWIMPIYRVAESIGASKEAFDVVIVDEASQSGPEAMFLAYIAKKMIVVGDDQQISPVAVGTNKAEVHLLQERYLKNHPHKDMFDVDRSLFDAAEIKFPGRIRLREHFRCMPEIIQFSNQLCYQAQPLIPLRQYGGNRLEPVVTRRVGDGYLKGSKQRIVNPPEAQAIVRQVAACCEDEKYEGLTFGVISLLGAYQAREIESLLLEELGPEVMSERQIVCGDAYAFQGDERDVVFLSLVSAVSENRRIGPLTSAAFERRFNVAASRARDQMWLFHSVDSADLGTSCLRRRLLEYCLNPQIEMSAAGDLSIAELQRQALAGGRDVIAPPVPFESWFEVDVYLEIVARGFRAVPQFEVAGRRIDMLIMGRTARLAVECDGDHWHGPDRYEEDDRRQRQLERCGLHFWRVRGSTYYLDPSQALESLWVKLSSMAIQPMAEWQDAAGGNAEETESNAATNWAPALVRHENADVPDTPTETEERESSEIELPEAKDDGSTARKRSSRDAAVQRELPIVPRSADAAYTNWESHDLPDPKETPRDEVIEGLLEIVGAEGPVFCRRLMGLYREAAGYLRMRSQLEGILVEAVQHAVDAGQMEAVPEMFREGVEDQVLRLPGGPEVIVRPLAGRSLHEVPPSEQATLVRRLRKGSPALAGEALCRTVLEFYGLKRLTGPIRSRMKWVEELVGTGK
jgi:very-short-patch-repair endonuclease